MALIVQKYGGTSLASSNHIQRIANRIKRYYGRNHKLAVVLSAMGHTTDELLRLAQSLHSNPKGRPVDMLLTTGEQVSVALMSIALDRIGVPAVSLTGAQARILVRGNHTDATIASIDTESIRERLSQKQVCLIAGFQGIDEDGEIYSLGRGGSDTTAVALAIALQADECEIFTDVDGIYTADPNKVTNAKRLKELPYEEMLELARLGAGVLHNRSVNLASKSGIVLHVRSSFNNSPGTLIMSEEKILEQAFVRGVTLKTDEARISAVNIQDRPGLAAQLFGSLAEKSINVDMIVQGTGQDGKNTISFTVLQKQMLEAKSITEEFVRRQGEGLVDVIPEVAVVSVIGVGMKSHSGVAATIFKTLADIGANIEMISTSEIRVSVVLHPEQGHRALEAVHSAFHLDQSG